MGQVPKHLTIEPEQHGDTAVIRLAGELDVAVERHLDETIEGLAAQTKTLVLDLRRLPRQEQPLRGIRHHVALERVEEVGPQDL